MPELPEVETLRRELSKILPGKIIKKVTVKGPKMVAPFKPATFSQKLSGKRIIDVERRAKMLLIGLNNDETLMIHLKMTGQLIFVKDNKFVVGGHPQKGGLENLPNKFTQLTIEFAGNSTLYFNDMRKFGWARLVKTGAVASITSNIGIEPLTKAFTREKLMEIIKRYPKRPLKQLLLDQSLIAGIGNIYADESAYLAGVLPMRLAGSLTTSEITKLHHGIVGVLKLSILKKGTSARHYRRANGKPGGMVPHLNVYGRANQKCKKCGTLITKIKFHARGTHFCTKCQK